MHDAIALQGVLVLESTDDGHVDGVVVLRARRECSTENDLVDGDPAHAERIAEGELVLSEGARLVGAQHVNARQLLDRHEAAHHRLLLGEQARADRHGHRQHGWHGHRNRRDGEDQHELQCVQDRLAAKE